MMTIVVAVFSAVVGGAIGIFYQRHQATWLKRRDTAAEAYESSIGANAAMTSSLTLARRVATALTSVGPGEFVRVAEEADWQLDGYLATLKTSISRLRDAELKVRSIWGNDIGDLFAQHLRVVTSYHNGLAEFNDDILGHSSEPNAFATNETGFDWANVIHGREPDVSALAGELERLTEWIRRFARAAGVVTIDLLELPGDVREVVLEFNDSRALSGRSTRMLKSGD